MSITTEILKVARIHDEHVTTSASFSESTSEHRLTVPTGQRYFVVGGHLDPDNSSTLSVRLKNSADLQIGVMMSESAGTAIKFFGGYAVTNNMSGGLTGGICPLEAGDYVMFDYGTAQGTASVIFCRVLVIDV